VKSHNMETKEQTSGRWSMHCPLSWSDRQPNPNREINKRTSGQCTSCKSVACLSSVALSTVSIYTTLPSSLIVICKLGSKPGSLGSRALETRTEPSPFATSWHPSPLVLDLAIDYRCAISSPSSPSLLMSCTLQLFSKISSLSETTFHRYGAVRPVAGGGHPSCIFSSCLLPRVEYLSGIVPLSAYKYTRIRLHREARQLAPFSPLILCVFQVVRPFHDFTRLLCRSGLSDLCLSMLVFATLIALADVFASPMLTTSTSPTSPAFANAYRLSPAIALRDLLALAPRRYLRFSHPTPSRASSLT